MADTCTFTPGFPHQLGQLYHPFFMILFLHARIGMLQLRLEQIQHGAGRLGPWKNKGCLTVYPTVVTKLQQWQWHDCGPRQLDHIWQASDGVGILRWNTVSHPRLPQYEYIARQPQIQTAWLMKSPFSLKCFLQRVPQMHWESQLSSLHYLLSWRHYSVSWQIRQPFASSQETCRPQRSSCPSQQHDGEETKRRWHILHEKTEDKSFSRHRFQSLVCRMATAPIRVLRVAPMPNMPNI